jgi:hypothetical protein
MVKIKLQSSGKYAGLIRVPVVRELLGDTAVRISATLVESKRNLSEPSTEEGSTLWRSFTARIVLTGLQPDRFRVSKLLSDSHLVLQHPYAEECGELEYCNPHYLLRPGASMPKLQNAAGFAPASVKPPGSLTELNKSRILQIFDSARHDNRQGSRLHNFTSHRLKSSLKQ